MGTSTSIIILLLPIYSAFNCFHINWSDTIYLFKLITTITDQLFATCSVKVKKSNVNYTVLFWHYGNEFVHCQ